MARRRSANADTARVAVDVFRQLPPAWRLAVVGLVVAGGLVYLLVQNAPSPTADTGEAEPHGPVIAGEASAAPPATPAGVPGVPSDAAGKVFFCFWNVENLFDDVNDKRRPTDEEYDDPFAQNAHLRQLKLDRLSSALLRINGGKGPDVIACVEVESTRSAELLTTALNAKLRDPKLRYTQGAMKNLDAGRHIAPCLISRLPIDHPRTRLVGSKVRILETHVRANGYDLCTVVSHWTSQLTDKTDGEDTHTGRGKYASIIHDIYADLAKSNPAVDFLVCGDFNDTPDSDAVVKILHATGDRTKVTSRAAPGYLLDLLADKPADRFGTLWYRGKPLIYDHICVSPGMLDDKGWSCDPDSIHVAAEGLIRPGATRREPWRFRDPAPPIKDSDRGYSDHFPVTVELRVAPPSP